MTNPNTTKPGVTFENEANNKRERDDRNKEDNSQVSNEQICENNINWTIPIQNSDEMWKNLPNAAKKICAYSKTKANLEGEFNLFALAEIVMRKLTSIKKKYLTSAQW